MVHKYNSYTTKKIPYRRMLNRIKIVELSKQPLSMAHRGKKTNTLLARTKRINIT